MITNPDFEIVKFAEDYMAVPVGMEATSFHGIVALSEPAAYLLDMMREPKTTEELILKLMERYDVDRSVAEDDVKAILNRFREMNLAIEA